MPDCSWEHEHQQLLRLAATSCPAASTYLGAGPAAAAALHANRESAEVPLVASMSPESLAAPAAVAPAGAVAMAAVAFVVTAAADAVAVPLRLLALRLVRWWSAMCSGKSAHALQPVLRHAPRPRPC